MSHPVTAILAGAGSRGRDAYGAYSLAHPDEIRFVAVAEPHDIRRARFAQEHNIPLDRQFCAWEDMLGREQFADVAVVCTPDSLHTAPAVAALEAGYDVLLEKPMAGNLADCVRLVRASERTGKLLQICHVLRYTPFFTAVHEIIATGRLGDLVTVEHRENVSYWHMAHSYVRGNWGNSRLSSPMILAKCCHDLDLLHWNLGRCMRLSSIGSLLHYRPKNAPPGAPERCTDGCPHAADCAWYAPRLYLDLVPLMHVARRSPNPWERLGAILSLDHPVLTRLLRRMVAPLNGAADYRGWPVSVISEDPSREARTKALETGPYGRCVYHCDNDVVDHQIVTMEFEGGVSAALTMHGHSHQEGRTLRVDGTRATLRGRYALYQEEIEIHDHLTGRVETIRPTVLRAGAGGHGGGDAGLMASFVRAARRQTQALTTARESLESHLMALAAEEARLSGQMVQMDDFRREAEAATAPDRPSL